MNNITRQFILKALSPEVKSQNDLARLKRQFSSQNKQPLISTAVLRKHYIALIKNNKIKPSKTLEKLLQCRPIRTLSGVAVVTVLTKPYPCPNSCIYCPSEVDMPKSYLKNEPAAARAYGLKFDPYRQVATRLKTLEKNGHPVDKIELIIKGGTWSAYPITYQNKFIERCFAACNSAQGGSAFKKNHGGQNIDQKKTLPLVQKLLLAQKKNESAPCRIIGLTIETRPDYVTPAEIKQLRFLGCTRVELGVQIVDDKILQKVKRSHSVKRVIEATKLLKDAGFKVDYHLMPNLPGATLKTDLENFKKVFNDPDFKPDMIKIYPCTVIGSSPLYKLWKDGAYKPYTDKQLLELLLKMKTIVPRYVRISRLIRDIPSTSISAGNKITNLRQTLSSEMERRNIRCKCLRCREAGHQKDINPNEKKKLFTQKYKASGGYEYFLSIEDKKRRVVYAFLRLRLPAQKNNPALPLRQQGEARIREVHTYGHLIPLQKEKNVKGQVQHLGLGKTMMAAAEKIARQNGFIKMSVISGVGVRPYYRKLGYKLKDTYMVKKL